MGNITSCLARVAVIAGALALPAAAAGEAPGGAIQARARSVRPTIQAGHDTARAWLHAQYRELSLRKQTVRASGELTIELAAAGDVLTLRVSRAGVLVSRADQVLAIDSPDALQRAQQVFGGSAAVFAARVMLSELERNSDFGAAEMSALSAAAFVASIAGDVGAPARVSDRFVAKHKGFYRPVRWEGTCWSRYSTETTAAWDELQDCMGDADDKGFFRAAYERLACNAVWALRSESAWFEYLACLGPLGYINQ